MLDANENYLVSTYLTDFNYRHLMSRIKINKSAIAVGTLHQGKYENYLTEDSKN